MRIMNAHSAPRVSCRSRAPCMNISRGSLREFAAPVVQAATAFIADFSD
jgi:hypothetical protein